MTSEVRAVGPLEHLGTEVGRDEEPIGRTDAGTWLLLQRRPNSLLNPPCNGGGQVSRGKDGVYCHGNLLLSLQELAGEGVGLYVAGPWAIGEGEIEPGEEEGPAGLPGVQSSGCPDVLQVLVVRPH